MSPSLLTECPPLDPLEGKTGEDLTKKLTEVGEQYNACKLGKKKLIEAVR